MGKGQEDLGLLQRLGRAAGLSMLGVATIGSGPCGNCEAPHDVCASIEDFNGERERGLAATADAAAGAPGNGDYSAVRLRENRSAAESWDGVSCPSNEQRHAIAELNGERAPQGEPTTSTGDGMCCYHVIPDCPGGRPFLVDGLARVAALQVAATVGDDSEKRHGSALALAQAWQADALTEHASVAAFARLSLQLLALGAPAELVKDAQLASLDELRHADFCFERASRHAGRRLSPGPLAVHGALDDLSLAGLIETNLREGCVGETLAALRIECQAERVADPELRSALLAISEDETRHAELAFRILAWCRQIAPELTRETVARVLARAEREAPMLQREEDEVYLAERSSRSAELASDRRAWRNILRPLLSSFAAAPRANALELS